MHQPLFRTAGFALVAIALSAGLSASGGVGFYGIVEKVVFEPNEGAPERAQVWGVFAYVDGGADSSGDVSSARRGFLYFALPPDSQLATTVKREWNDLKSVAGTGQAVGFGAWGYIGRFQDLDPNRRTSSPPYILELYPGHGVQTDLRVRPVTEKPANPAVYQTNVGVVKISAQGSRGDVVRRLQQEIQTP